ncbi:hypothetical protein BKA62DRAFT_718012 [Auriculariales sp. MPI-PUGE-AT-0066]|nr:hypothetical protein BKA62DRAFT_718012 [Auriculariales sp. MPI-PUGE-AT-0066]
MVEPSETAEDTTTGTCHGDRSIVFTKSRTDFLADDPVEPTQTFEPVVEEDTALSPGAVKEVTSASEDSADESDDASDEEVSSRSMSASEDSADESGNSSDEEEDLPPPSAPAAANKGKLPARLTVRTVKDQYWKVRAFVRPSRLRQALIIKCVASGSWIVRYRLLRLTPEAHC